MDIFIWLFQTAPWLEILNDRKLIARVNSNITVCVTVLVLVSCCHSRQFDEPNFICLCMFHLLFHMKWWMNWQFWHHSGDKTGDASMIYQRYEGAHPISEWLVILLVASRESQNFKQECVAQLGPCRGQKWPQEPWFKCLFTHKLKNNASPYLQRIHNKKIYNSWKHEKVPEAAGRLQAQNQLMENKEEVFVTFPPYFDLFKIYGSKHKTDFQCCTSNVRH